MATHFYGKCAVAIEKMLHRDGNFVAIATPGDHVVARRAGGRCGRPHCPDPIGGAQALAYGQFSKKFFSKVPGPGIQVAPPPDTETGE